MVFRSIRALAGASPEADVVSGESLALRGIELEICSCAERAEQDFRQEETVVVVFVAYSSSRRRSGSG